MVFEIFKRWKKSKTETKPGSKFARVHSLKTSFLSSIFNFPFSTKPFASNGVALFRPTYNGDTNESLCEEPLKWHSKESFFLLEYCFHFSPASIRRTQLSCCALRHFLRSFKICINQEHNCTHKTIRHKAPHNDITIGVDKERLDRRQLEESLSALCTHEGWRSFLGIEVREQLRKRMKRK